ncbi:hypothetical protein EMCG_04517 [[Emmonsia] crescens]|uniref:Uncharacterized protein n=1 Tax=[Emmonsia] crescens TaxID=73230 RepID=A0A0G2J7D6_9EURO|nr:hypothetical protein EMCG_04517 [Emmonsia crescens UAMH 3008]
MATSIASPTTPYSTQTHNQSYNKPISSTAPTYTVTVNARQANNNNKSNMQTSVLLDAAFASAPASAPADEGGVERRGSRFSHRRATRKPVM